MEAAEIVARLEEATATMALLPHGGGRLRMKLQSYILDDSPGSARPGVRLSAEPKNIDRADAALTWLSLIPADKFVLRRVVGCRSMVSPVTGRHLFSWRKIGALLGCDHKAVQRWHAQGVAIIASELNRRPNAV